MSQDSYWVLLSRSQRGLTVCLVTLALLASEKVFAQTAKPSTTGPS